jgi:hypothetical protein
MNKKMYECRCGKGCYESDGAFVTSPCDGCGWNGSRRPKSPVIMMRPTEFRNAQKLANRMRRNGAPEWEILALTGQGPG